MTKNIFIHIGPHKTGTSTIQRGLWKNQKQLVKHYYLYPLINGSIAARAHHNLAWELRGKSKFSEGEGTWLDVLGEIDRNSNASSIILSSEEFSFLSVEEIFELREKLKSFQVFIVCYIRRQDDLLQSLWSQVTKNGHNAMSFTKWLEHHHYAYEFSDYEKFLNKWSAVFQKQNMKIGIFERQQINGNLFHHFLNLCGIKDTSLFSVPKNANVAPGFNTLEIIRQMKAANPQNRHIDGLKIGADFVQEFAEKKGWNAKHLDLIDSRTFHMIMERYEVSNRAVAQTYFNRDDLFFDTYTENKKSKNSIDTIDKQEIIEMVRFVVGEYNQSNNQNLLQSRFRGMNLRRQNIILRREIDRILDSFLWKFVYWILSVVEKKY